jgi:hypothetical protein
MKSRADAGDRTASARASRRRRLGLGLVLLLGAGIAVAIVLGTRSPSPRPTANAGSTGGAATVERRDLIETDTESGTLGYANPQTVYNRLTGTVTWLPAVGVVVNPGQTLYSINGHPVVLFDGALPAYRALSAKDSAGLDILQLNRDLVQMGFADGEIAVDDAWQAGTTDAVERWQASLGERHTGKIALGEIVFLPGPQRVTQLETTCGSTGGGSSGGVSSGSGSGPTNGCGVAEASAATPEPQREFVDITTTSTTTTPSATTTTPTTTTTPKTRAPGSGRPAGGAGHGGGRRSRGRKAARSGSGHSGGSGTDSSGAASGGGSGGGKGSSGAGSDVGGIAGSASAILQTTSTKLLVTVDLAASSQREAVVGSHVTVEMPDGSNVSGTITAVSAVAQNSSSSNSSTGGGAGTSGNGGSGGSSATVPVTIALDERVKGAGLDQAAVSVNFIQEKAGNVLSVPVTALIATAGESYAVQDASPPYKLIPVTTGLFAAGFVQISGAGVHAGLQVTDSQG